MAEVVAFTNATVLDGLGGKAQGQTVLVEGGRISGIGQGSAPSHARTIDLGGCTLMPGMSVCHWHGEYVQIGPPRFGGNLRGLFIGLEESPAVLALYAARSMQIALASGVTNVISAGCSNDLDAQMADALKKGVFRGPRITPCSRHVVATGDYEDRGNWWAAHPATEQGIRRIGGNVFADGVPEMIKATRQEIARGARMIKLLPTGEHGSGSTPGYRGLSLAELQAVVETAHERGARVRAHAATKQGILESVAAGVDIIDHADEMDEECLEAMAKAGSIWTPSMFFAKLVSYGGNGQARPGNKADAAWDNLVKMLPRANEAGIIIVPGDDYGAQGLDHAPGVYATELEIYVRDAGMPASEVLRWATSNGARAALDDKDYGSIQVGKVADLVVVDGDPSEDIGLLRRPLETLKAIMLGGEWVKNEMGGVGVDATIRFQGEMPVLGVAAE